jgi:hypothetical protein
VAVGHSKACGVDKTPIVLEPKSAKQKETINARIQSNQQ